MKIQPPILITGAYSGDYYIKDWLNKAECSEFIDRVGYILYKEQNPYEEY